MPCSAHRSAATSPPVIDARKFDGSQQWPAGEVTYYVVKTSVPHGFGKTSSTAKARPQAPWGTATVKPTRESRVSPRQRTRLRSGQIFDPLKRELIDCQIYDRSETGARLRLFANIQFPPKIRVYEDQPDRRNDALIVWRKGREIGVRFIVSKRTL